MSALLPVLVLSIPVLLIAVLAIAGRRLSGSCGGLSADGSCNRCGRTAGSGSPGSNACG